jgi:hypothetical protein
MGEPGGYKVVDFFTSTVIPVLKPGQHLMKYDLMVVNLQQQIVEVHNIWNIMLSLYHYCAYSY